MDKLKPILAQKFWILFSTVLILPLVGYFMTKGKLATEIDDRWKKLTDSFTGIPDGNGVPNDSWTQRLTLINEQQTQHNRHANQELWAEQKKKMFWPSDVAPFLTNAKYFEPLTAQQQGEQVIFNYPLSYNTQVRALWEIVDPLDDGENRRDSDKRRKVKFAMADLHLSRIANLGNLQPEFFEIWHAQEDIWLQTELLNAVRRLNENASNQGDAFVKHLDKILLFGGTQVTGEAGTATASGASDGGMLSGGSDSMAGMGGFGGGGFGSQRSESSGQSADISLAEEFNVENEGDGGGGGGGGFGRGGSGAMMSGESAGAGSSDTGGGGSAGEAKPESKRYLDYDEKRAYKRRGFYIKLVMDHRKVPDLIAELMHSPFPVEIVRVQQTWLLDSGNTSPSGGDGSMAGRGGFGFGIGGGSKASDRDGGNAALSPGSGGPSVGFGKPGSAGGRSAALPGGNAGSIENDGGAGLFGSFGSGAGSGTGGGAGGGAMRGADLSGSGSAAALADPNLAHVAILGVWTLYLPPPPLTDAEKPATPNSALPASGLAATPGEATPAAADSTEAARTDAKPATTEPTESTADEAKKPSDPDAPKSESAKPEKTESDTEKPAAEKTPPKDDAADKPPAESK